VVVKKVTGERLRDCCGYLNAKTKFVFLLDEEGERDDGYLSLGHLDKFRELVAGQEGKGVKDYKDWIGKQKRARLYRRLEEKEGVTVGEWESDESGEEVEESPLVY
jgi:hypothetical protein